MKNNVILIVDDVEINRDMLAALFSNDYTILEAANGEEAMDLIAAHKNELVVVLLDISMPKKDGFDVLDYMRFSKAINNIPVIMISASDSEADEMEGLRRGASDFISKPFNSNIVKQRVRNGIELFRYKRSLERMIKQQTEKYMGITEFVIDVLVSVMQVKNNSTRRSLQRIRSYTKEILNFIYEYCDDKFGLTLQKISLISTASILHDIGMLLIPEELIGKKVWTEQERALVEAHTERGCDIIESMSNLENRDYIDMALEICRYHHERWDGSGYPEKLVGDEIPISAQVVGIADTYDGLREGSLTGRRYSHKETMEALERGDFGMFSPVLIESCKMMQGKLDEIYGQNME